MFSVSQVLYLATAVGEESTSGPMTVVQMCQQPWLHPQLQVYHCVTECMRLLSENRHFHSIVAILLDPLFSIFEELASRTLNLWGGWQFCFNIPLLQP